MDMPGNDGYYGSALASAVSSGAVSTATLNAMVTPILTEMFGTANGTLVDLYTCNGTGAQVWQPQSNGAIVNPESGSCLDDTGWSTTPGTKVQIWACTGGANQSWSLP
jgi:beta-glucosidase